MFHCRLKVGTLCCIWNALTIPTSIPLVIVSTLTKGLVCHGNLSRVHVQLQASEKIHDGWNGDKTVCSTGLDKAQKNKMKRGRKEGKNLPLFKEVEMKSWDYCGWRKHTTQPNQTTESTVLTLTNEAVFLEWFPLTIALVSKASKFTLYQNARND